MYFLGRSIIFSIICHHMGQRGNSPWCFLGKSLILGLECQQVDKSSGKNIEIKNKTKEIEIIKYFFIVYSPTVWSWRPPVFFLNELTRQQKHLSNSNCLQWKWQFARAIGKQDHILVRKTYLNLQLSCGLSHPENSGEVRITSHVPLPNPEGKKEKINKAMEQKKWMRPTRNWSLVS